VTRFKADLLSRIFPGGTKENNTQIGVLGPRTEPGTFLIRSISAKRFLTARSGRGPFRTNFVIYYNVLVTPISQWTGVI
jgi:hypothetical protein